MGYSEFTAEEEVQQLEQFQRKSAAIETVFTLAVLYVSVLQIFPLRTWSYQILALVPVVFLLGIVYTLGGDNLKDQLQNAI